MRVTEFGRTPVSQGTGKTAGRDHHPGCFTCWLAGAGVKPGFAYGTSDEVGYQPADKPVTVYDLHATVLHLLGLDHEKLTFYHNGIQRRLTDVHGQVIGAIFAEGVAVCAQSNAARPLGTLGIPLTSRHGRRMVRSRVWLGSSLCRG